MSEIRVDTISEKTSANGVAIDSLGIKDGKITNLMNATLSAADLGAGVHIKTADSGQSAANANRDELVLENSGHCGMTILSGTSSVGGIAFGDSGGNLQGLIQYSHANEQFEFNVNSSANPVNINSSGITLGGTGAANTLDDYEEGTYAPVFTVASGSLTPHGSHNALAYTKIGRVVHVQGEVRFSAVSSPSGNFSVSLPFAVADLTDGAARSTSGAIGQSGFGGTPDATYYLRITSEGTTTAFFATHNSGSDTGVNANQVSTSTEMILSFTFIAA